MSGMGNTGQDRRACEHCGSEVGPGDAFCSSCGARTGGARPGGARRAGAVGGGTGGSGVGRAGEPRDPAIAGERRPDDPGAHPTSRLYEEEQGRRLFDRTVGLPPDEALRGALEHAMTHESMGFSVAAEGVHSVTFRNYRPPNPWVTALLLVPALLYWAAANLSADLAFSGLVFLVLLFPVPVYQVGAGRHAYSSVVALPAPGGCVVRIGGDSERAYGRLYAWVAALPPAEPAGGPEG